ncbi:hypothetical protein M231_05377 [Tremella mesenterica]|uniref:RRM domain-containing protein n=1 Tax=Tremella mesenterica TaxID=5217 RepID=A0A4Q1BIE7_TREME|nr:hypothetical protein M231_05377 [Tremella mesenterica]
MALQQPPRAPSAASGISGMSGLSKGPSSGSDSLGSPDDPSHYQHAPHASLSMHPGVGVPIPNADPSAFLPPVTSSPPPQTPSYIPPPQHAMAPDPIHSMPSWPPEPWRAGPSQFPPRSAYRQSVPNGHMQHNIPANLDSSYPRSMSIAGTGVGIGGVGLQHPAMQAVMMNGNRPGSAQGRRRREREDERERERDEDEVISTIFVVGFPDDMQEREFANLFTFAPGFEAATLKFPSGQRHREPTAALLAELQHLAALQQEHGEGNQPGLEDAIAALQLSATASTSASTTPSAAISLTPSAPSNPMLGGGGPTLPSIPPRRQTIGFARFRSRADALSAKEHLQGRRIDVLTGATLKAEMAKKNLHTKRNATNEEFLGLLLRSGRLAGLVHPGISGSNPGLSINGQGNLSSASQSAKEAWDSFDRERQSQNILSQSDPTRSTVQPSSVSSPLNSFPPYHPGSSMTNPSSSPPLSAKSPTTRPSNSKALLALAEEEDELEGWSVGMGVGTVGMVSGYVPRRAERLEILDRPGAAGQPTVVGMGYQSHTAFQGFGSSPPGGSDHMSETRSLGALSNTNPADQNPPINTLYVGNLPAISPPTHPPNFLEEALRGLFSRSAGFKRMSFRQKINGPMCFVEFEDIPYAAQAIQELYGHTLGGLVKGGIRLSYSKNSLGQRGSSHQTITPPVFGGIAQAVAMAHLNTTSPNQYGSAPIPMPQAENRDDPSLMGTSLSPTAAPFMAMSPRSRYFDSSVFSSSSVPSSSPNAPNVNSNNTNSSNGRDSFSAGVPVGGSGHGSGSGTGGGYTSFPSTTNSNISNTTTAPVPVGSPIRTPASFSWLGGGAYGFGDGPFNNLTPGSLTGAANAWTQTPSGH